MFVGEFTCLAVFFIRRQMNKKSLVEDDEEQEIPLSPGTQMAKKTQQKTTINPLYLAIPATFDLCGSTTMFIGLTQCASSIYQMMRGFIVVITSILAVLFLGRKQYMHHVGSLIFIVIAVVLVGLAGIYGPDNKDDSGDDSGAGTTVLGVTLIIIAQFFTGGQFITEEKILSGYYLDPLLVVGLEGMWGCIWYAILLPIFQNIDCSNPDFCPYGCVEDTKAVFHEMGDHPEIIVYSCLIIVSIACFNATGVAVTKYASAPQRSTIDTCRTLFVWIVAMIQGQEKWMWSEFGGFVILVIATLTYNEILILPCEFCNKNTRVKMAERETEDGGMDDQQTMLKNKKEVVNYVATSPHAAYDSNRNIRALNMKMQERDDLLQQHNDNDIGRSGSTIAMDQ